MDFDLIDEQKKLRKTVREFGTEEIRPIAVEYDRAEIYPWDVVETAAENGSYCTLNSDGVRGAGYVDDFDSERFYRDAKFTQIYEDTPKSKRISLHANSSGRIL